MHSWWQTVMNNECGLCRTKAESNLNESVTHPFNSPLSRTTRVRQYQKGKTNLNFTEARDSEWQWHQLGYMQVCTSLQADNHISSPPLSFLAGWMPFLPPKQQCQSTERTNHWVCKSVGFQVCKNCRLLFFLNSNSATSLQLILWGGTG